MAPRAATNGASSKDGEPPEDKCPVCHSTRYLNPHIKFLVSTECYHKMCEGCVERLLSRGPGPCPVAGCKATIRRHRFRVPTFDSLALEKEVDIRRDMSKTFNRREEDFESLRDYNDYLAEVEDMTFNLINGIDVEETYAKIEDYRKAHLRAIEQNKDLEEEGAKAFKEAQKAEEEAIKFKRQAAIQEQERERQEQQEIEQEYITQLQAGGDPEELAKERSARLQMAAARRKAAVDDAVTAGVQSTLIRGLRKKGKKQDDLPPFDPFDGLPTIDTYFSALQEYPGDLTFRDLDRDARINAGGYSKPEFYRWALVDAFAGLGVRVGDEKVS